MTDFTRANVMKLIQRMHIRSRHAKYINDEIEYEDYKEYINYVIIFFRPNLTGNDLDLIWQNLNLAGPDWRYVREELFSAIAG